MNMQLNNSLFKVEPSSKATIAISEAYKKKAFNSISSISNAIHKILGISIHRIIKETINQLNSFPVSSNFYSYNTRLVHSLTVLRDINVAQQILKKLSIQNISDLISYYPRISNLDHYDWSLEFGMDTVKDYKEINDNIYASIQPVSDNLYQQNIKTLSQALALLKNKAYLFYEEISNYVSDIILFEGKGISGGTSSRFMGSIFIRIPKQLKITELHGNKITLVHLTPLVYYLEQLVHETAHLHLDQLMEFDPIVLNDANEKFDSPLRKDKRPMRGVFHATFVLARLTKLFSSINLTGSDEVLKNARLLTIQGSLNDGINTIKQHGLLTTSGKKLFYEMKHVVDSQ